MAKTIYITTDANNHVTGWASQRGRISDIQMTVEDNHEVLINPFIYVIENGQLKKDDAYQQQLIQESENHLTDIESLKKQDADLTFNLMMKGVI